VVKNGHIAGIAVAVEGWSGYYPVHHEQGGNMDKKLVFAWLPRAIQPGKYYIYLS
jgi:hypothetical protein